MRRICCWQSFFPYASPKPQFDRRTHCPQIRRAYRHWGNAKRPSAEIFRTKQIMQMILCRSQEIFSLKQQINKRHYEGKPMSSIHYTVPVEETFSRLTILPYPAKSLFYDILERCYHIRNVQWCSTPLCEMWRLPRAFFRCACYADYSHHLLHQHLVRRKENFYRAVLCKTVEHLKQANNFIRRDGILSKYNPFLVLISM